MCKEEQFRSETIHLKPHVRRLPVVLEVVFEEEQLAERIAWKKTERLRPQSRERNPRSQSHLNLENSLTAACASPVSSWPLSSISWLPSLASTSSEPEPSWPSSQVSTAARAPSGAPPPESARSHLRPALPRS